MPVAALLLAMSTPVIGVQDAQAERAVELCAGVRLPDCLDDALRAVESLPEGSSARLVLQARLAARAAAAGRPALADRLIGEALKHVDGRKDAATAIVLTQAADLAVARSGYDEARRHAVRVVELLERQEGGMDRDLVAALLVLGEADLRANQYDEAGDSFRRAADLATAAKQDDFQIAALHGLAEVFALTERRTEARPLYERAVAIGQAGGTAYQSMIGLYRDYSYFRLVDGDREDARKWLKEAIAVGRVTVGPQGPELGGSILDLAELELRLGNLQEAEAYAAEAAAIYAVALDKQNGRRGDPHRVLGHLAYMRKDYEAARGHLGRALGEMTVRPRRSLTRLSTQLELARSATLADPASPKGWSLARDVGDVVAAMVGDQAHRAAVAGPVGSDQRHIFDIGLSVAWNHAQAAK